MSFKKAIERIREYIDGDLWNDAEVGTDPDYIKAFEKVLDIVKEEAEKASPCAKCQEFEFKVKTIQQAYDGTKEKAAITGEDKKQELFYLGTVLAVLKGDNTEYWAKKTDYEVGEFGSLTEVKDGQ